MPEYTLTRSFATAVTRTPRVMEVAEAFGIGLSDRRFVLYEDLKLKIEPADVVYITGQSGSGKSSLLRDLSAEMRAAGLVVANVDDVVMMDKPLIDLLGRDVDDALKKLVAGGNTDAHLWVRTPAELSDGQRYRLRLALLLECAADVWVADEFGAVLDRDTAKAVAFTMQKTARSRNITLMVATTHTDLEHDLNPSVVFEKYFQARIKVRLAQDGQSIMKEGTV